MLLIYPKGDLDKLVTVIKLAYAKLFTVAASQKLRHNNCDSGLLYAILNPSCKMIIHYSHTDKWYTLCTTLSPYPLCAHHHKLQEIILSQAQCLPTYVKDYLCLCEDRSHQAQEGINSMVRGALVSHPSTSCQKETIIMLQLSVSFILLCTIWHI